jgi:hypothetical protein
MPTMLPKRSLRRTAALTLSADAGIRIAEKVQQHKTRSNYE